MQLADKLVQIAENELKVYNDGKFSVVENIEPFYGQEQGLAVVASNVTTVDHEVAVKLSSKNLLNLEGRELVDFGAFDTKNKRTFTGKSIICGLSANNYYSKNYTQEYKIENNSIEYEVSGWYGIGLDVKLQPNTTYKMSFGTVTGSSGFTLMQYDIDGNFLGYGNGWTTFSNTDWGVLLLTASNGTVSATNPQLEIGNTATVYTPYTTDFLDYKVKVTGKNLLDKSNYAQWANQGNALGICLDNLIDGQTYTFSTNIPLKQIKISNHPGGYTCDGSANNDNGFTSHTWTHKRAAQISANTTLYMHFILVGNTTMVNDISQLDGYQLQIECGTTPTEYTEYIEPTEYTATADGTVKGVKSFAPTMTLISENSNSIINANYIKDIDKVFEETITQIALSGGE